MRIGSLCSGYGGLDLAVEAYFNGQTVWMSDIDKASITAIEKNWKVKNLGDLKQVDWSQVEPIDILTAGYPCQPFSHAGQRKGTKDERHLWPHIKEIIGTLRPKLVVLENVRGHLSLGFKEVLEGLTEIGYDAKWTIVRASDVGAPHQRARLFIIAHPNSATCEQPRRGLDTIPSEGSAIINGSNRQESWGSVTTVSDTDTKQLPSDRQTPRLGRRFETQFDMRLRSVPDPLVDGKLNTKYVEYMMGLPEGWVTDLPLSRAQQFKLLGNGVVPQQAYYALELLCDSHHISYDTPRE
jgi:DNA (cytosine-5)-methyltransferase 1